ncbi:hypothetical protein K438DRAFT_2145912 [Mycena galopus ATCC 62051]|nr:hypothetical protein K438DRAFT_2145912 [Mycena galopus ATCC 62051]
MGDVNNELDSEQLDQMLNEDEPQVGQDDDDPQDFAWFSDEEYGGADNVDECGPGNWNQRMVIVVPRGNLQAPELPANTGHLDALRLQSPTLLVNSRSPSMGFMGRISALFHPSQLPHSSPQWKRSIVTFSRTTIWLYQRRFWMLVGLAGQDLIEWTAAVAAILNGAARRGNCVVTAYDHGVYAQPPDPRLPIIFTVRTLREVALPALAHLTTGRCGIALPDLDLFLVRHAFIVSLDLGSYPAFGTAVPPGSAPMIPRLATLTVTPGLLVHFLGGKGSEAWYPALRTVWITTSRGSAHLDEQFSGVGWEICVAAPSLTSVFYDTTLSGLKAYCSG